MSDPRGRKWLYGKTVVDGQLRFLSVSQLSKADPEEEGCPRRWYYETVLGRKPPQTRAAGRGDSAHDQIAKYLQTGEKALDQLVMSGFHMLPKPGPDLLVEHDMVLRPNDPEPTTEAEAAIALARAPVRCAGVPLLGRMDLVHGRGENQGAENLDEAYDPPGTVENCDWKTTGNVKNVKPKARLLRLIQMAGYGTWSKTVEPGLTHLRLSHGYFVEAGGGGPSRKVSLRVLPEAVDPAWARAESIARVLKDAARETSADRIEANTRACVTYGGRVKCYQRDICTAGQQETLASFFGPAAADRMRGRTTESDPMPNLLDKIKNKNAPAPATTAPATGGVAAAPNLAAMLGKTTPAGPTPAEIEARARADAAAKEAEIQKVRAEELARLQAEETEQRGRRAVADTLTKIEAYGLGRPALGGEAARFYNLSQGRQHDAQSGVAGLGQLGELNTHSLDDLTKLAGELAQLAAAGQISEPAGVPVPEPVSAAAPALLPPEAPESPVQAVRAAAETDPMADANARAAIGGANMAYAVAVAQGAAPAEAPKKPRGSRKPPPTETPSDGTPAWNGTLLLINCTVEGASTAVSLWPWIDEILADAERECKVDDIRAAPDSSGLAFGKWQGALGAACREKPLPEVGPWVLDTRDSQVGAIAADALARRVRQAGGIVIRGIR